MRRSTALAAFAIGAAIALAVRVGAHRAPEGGAWPALEAVGGIALIALLVVGVVLLARAASATAAAAPDAEAAARRLRLWALSLGGLAAAMVAVAWMPAV